MDFVPVLIKHLSFAEDQRLKFASVVGDAELDGRLAGIQRHFELGPSPHVADADNVPCRLWRLARPERADERKLLRKTLREDVPRWNDEVRLVFQTVSSLQAARTAHSRHSRIARLEYVQPELTNEIERLQIVLARSVVGARPVAGAVLCGSRRRRCGRTSENGQVASIWGR